METKTFSAPITLYIYESDELPPVIGSHAERLFDLPNSIPGFYFDRRPWVDEETDSYRTTTTIGALTSQTTDQLKTTYWQSGIGYGNDCQLKYIIKAQKETIPKWSPVLYRGDYFSHHYNYYLWSDQSILHPLIINYYGSFDAENNYVLLDKVPKTDSPIVASIFRRESNYSALPYREAQAVPYFTGTIVTAGTRSDTIDSNDNPIYSALDTFHRWEIYLKLGDRKSVV